MHTSESFNLAASRRDPIRWIKHTRAFSPTEKKSRDRQSKAGMSPPEVSKEPEASYFQSSKSWPGQDGSWNKEEEFSPPPGSLPGSDFHFHLIDQHSVAGPYLTVQYAGKI